MLRLRSPVVGLAALLLTSSASAQHPTQPKTDPAYTDAVMRELGRCDSDAGAAVCGCDRENGSPGLGSVTLTLAIGDGGQVLRVDAQPAGPFAECLRAALRGRRVKAPPAAPWYVQVRRIVPGDVIRR